MNEVTLFSAYSVTFIDRVVTLDFFIIKSAQFIYIRQKMQKNKQYKLDVFLKNYLLLGSIKCLRNPEKRFKPQFCIQKLHRLKLWTYCPCQPGGVIDRIQVSNTEKHEDNSDEKLRLSPNLSKMHEWTKDSKLFKIQSIMKTFLKWQNVTVEKWPEITKLPPAEN